MPSASPTAELIAHGCTELVASSGASPAPGQCQPSGGEFVSQCCTWCVARWRNRWVSCCSSASPGAVELLPVGSAHFSQCWLRQSVPLSAVDYSSAGRLAPGAPGSTAELRPAGRAPTDRLVPVTLAPLRGLDQLLLDLPALLLASRLVLVRLIECSTTDGNCAPRHLFLLSCSVLLPVASLRLARHRGRLARPVLFRRRRPAARPAPPESVANGSEGRMRQ
jgi:hypothetical protein